MFENLSDKLNTAFKKLKGHGKLTEKNIEEGLKDVRMALLEADAHYKVVKDFIAGVKARAIGQEVLSSLTPAQQVIKIVNEELISTLGEPGGPRTPRTGSAAPGRCARGRPRLSERAGPDRPGGAGRGDPRTDHHVDGAQPCEVRRDVFEPVLECTGKRNCQGEADGGIGQFLSHCCGLSSGLDRVLAGGVWRGLSL